MMPSFTTELSETLAPGNPLGVRGGGEGGTTPALGVVVNAVVDALSDYGVTHIEMPVTAEQRLAGDPAGQEVDATQNEPPTAGVNGRTKWQTKFW